ncbi:MAG TPA: secretin N-terminal domain-containing protein, partial [Longimicrobiales bacterium]|nr:secretin N-terminal domain-containing protein [Longimicrobiales bacterium]
MMSSILALWTSVAVAFGGPVKEVRIAPGANTTEVAVAVDGVVGVREFTMEAPHRLFVDLVGARNAIDGEMFAIDRGGVVSLTATQYSDDVVRLVLELEDEVAYEVFSEDGRVLIALENPGASFAPWSSGERMVAAPAGADVPAATQQMASQEADRMNIEFVNTPIEDVIFTFSEFSGRSIILGTGVDAQISAKIDNQPWDQALEAILRANGYVAQEGQSGIIRVVEGQSLQQQEAFEPMVTRTYLLNYATAEEVAEALQSIVQPQQGAGGGGGGGGGGQGARGSAEAVAGSNSVVVTAIPRMHDQVAQALVSLDRRFPSVNIQAKIIFVNRTDLNELGITYDLKDSRGNQLNLIAPGAVDANGDGVIDLESESVEQGTNVVSLGGNSIAALGNANSRLPNPSIQLLSSLIIGRHTLINFIEALEQSNLSDIQAEPYQTVLNNQQARIQVGERTPLRVLDAGALGGAGGGAATPQATVDFQETGIILEATPTVTNNGEIILQLSAERSAPQVAES